MRPLYDPGAGDGREAARTFTLLDHAADGVTGFYSIVGGKLTTFRLMAEKIVDAVCRQIGSSAPCTTATTPLPHHTKTNGHATAPLRYHELRARLDALEHGHAPGALICECEIVTDRQIREALARGQVSNLHDLRRDLRLGMGPCQGGFCAYRAAAIWHKFAPGTPEHKIELLREYVERRLGGMKPLLWGHNLRQALLNEHLYGRTLGLMPPQSGGTAQPAPAPTAPATISSGARPRVLVIGAGLAGLMAALAAQQSGATVEVIALGQGALTLHPGWIEIGDLERLQGQPDHPYAVAASGLTPGLGLIDRIVGLHPTGGWALTGLGSRRPVAYGAGILTAPIAEGTRILIVGIDGWRDFYPDLIADHLRAQGFAARACTISLPHQGGSFDDWTIDIAHLLDTADGQRQLIEQVKRQIGDAEVVAFPAVLGMERESARTIQASLDRTVVEIPTLTPSVPGLRLYHALRRALLDGGARFTLGPRVTSLHIEGGRAHSAVAESSSTRPRTIRADAIILATGGLYGSGLESDYQGQVVETVAGVPVALVPPRADWFDQPFTSGAPQAIHRAGVRVDAHMRPLDADGAPVAANLFACGRLLAGSSPVAEGCTEGADIASGWLAGCESVRQLSAAAATTR